MSNSNNNNNKEEEEGEVNWFPWGIKRYFRLYKSIKTATKKELVEMLEELADISNRIIEEANSRDGS